MRCLLGLAILAFGTSVANADMLSYHFDSDNEGWRRADFNQISLVLTDLGPATWNSGGYIDADDFSSWAFHVSPLLSGDYSSATSISFDYSSAASDAAYPFLVLANASEGIFQMNAVPADGAFHHYTYDFTPGTWQYSDGVNFRVATTTDIQNVLSSLKVIGINADQQSGADYTRVDNVAVVPEPTSLFAVVTGLTIVCRRRRSKRV